MTALPFFPRPFNSPFILTISLYGPPPQTLTCNRHCQAAFKVLFLDHCFSFLYMNDRPLFLSSFVNVSFHANDFAIWASSPNVDVQLPLLGCPQGSVFDQSFFLYE